MFLSDFHLMTVIVLRNIYQKFQLRIVFYRSYKHFSNKNHWEKLLHNFSKVTLINKVGGFQILVMYNLQH